MSDEMHFCVKRCQKNGQLIIEGMKKLIQEKKLELIRLLTSIIKSARLHLRK